MDDRNSDAPITDDWLKASGFRLQKPFGNYTERVLPVKGDCRDGLTAGDAEDDLCIVVGRPVDSDPAAWFVWVYQAEPLRHIHVRQMRCQWEVACLWEGLTGQAWNDRRIKEAR
jgi:hypothetical protein